MSYTNGFGASNGPVDFDPSLKNNDRLKVEVLSLGTNIQVSSDDTTPGFIEQKVLGTAGNIEVTTQNPGGNENLKIDLANAGTAGTYGSSTQIPVITTDAKGRVSGVTTASITAGVTDHGALTGLADDDHSQYALLAGRAGGQVLRGGTNAGDDITIESTSNATKGHVIVQPSGGSVGVGGTPDASAKFQVDSTTQGFLLPRMTTAQMNAISSPATGLQILNTNIGAVCTFLNGVWSFVYSKSTTAVQSITTTTYTAVTELVLPNLPIGRYMVEYHGIAQTTSVGAGIGFRLGQGSSVFGQISVQWFISQAGNGTAQTFQYNQLAAATNVSSTTILTANVDFPVVGQGVFEITTAGAPQIEFRTEAATLSSVRPNSMVSIRRIL